MTKPQRTMPVHALGDERIHLAKAQHGNLRLGRLRTLCGLQAVSALALFAAVESKARCRTCFGKVDEHGDLKPGANGSGNAQERGMPQ